MVLSYLSGCLFQCILNHVSGFFFFPPLFSKECIDSYGFSSYPSLVLLVIAKKLQDCKTIWASYSNFLDGLEGTFFLRLSVLLDFTRSFLLLWDHVICSELIKKNVYLFWYFQNYNATGQALCALMRHPWLFFQCFLWHVLLNDCLAWIISL